MTLKKHRDSETKPFFKRRKVIIVTSIIAFLLLLRLLLPYIVLHYVNKMLADMKGYYGHVDDIDLHIYRGAYSINTIYLNKVDSNTNEQVPFFSSEVIDLSVEWNALFHKRIVGELELRQPKLKFTMSKVEPKTVAGDTDDFRYVIKKLMPLKINRLEIIEGTIQFTDSGVTPVVDLHLDNTHILARNLSNVEDTAVLPASVTASANAYKGTLNLAMRMNALAQDPMFDMDAQLNNTSLPEFNNFFKAYAKFDVHKGTFGLYTEIASKDRKFKGYVKPIIKDLEVKGPEDRKDNVLNKLWEGVVGVAGEVLKNRKKDQVATKIPLEGTFDASVTDIWYAVFELLRNAFIQALYPSLDYDITIGDVNAVKPEEKKSLKERLFHKKDKDHDKDRDNRKDKKKEKKE